MPTIGRTLTLRPESGFGGGREDVRQRRRSMIAQQRDRGRGVTRQGGLHEQLVLPRDVARLIVVTRPVAPIAAVALVENAADELERRRSAGLIQRLMEGDVAR